MTVLRANAGTLLAPDYINVGCGERATPGRLLLPQPDGSWLHEICPDDGFFDDFDRPNGPVGNGWTTITGGIVGGAAKALFGRELPDDNFDLTLIVPEGIDATYMNIGFGLTSADPSPPAEFHVLTVGMAFGGGMQIHWRNASGTLSSYWHVTQPAAIVPGDEIHLRVVNGWIEADVNGVWTDSAPFLTTPYGRWLVIDTGGSTVTVDDLLILPIGIPLRAFDGTSWVDVACMVPAPGIGVEGGLGIGPFGSAPFGGTP